MSQLPYVTSADLDGSCAVIDALGGNAGDVQDLIDSVIDAATDLMWRLTGRQFGVSSTTVRPDLGGSATLLELEYPVTSVEAVKIDGETLPSSAYWVSDDRYLQRTDGAAWPSTQKQYLADDEDETFSVSFTWGTPPPTAIRSATRRLACEMLAMALNQPTSLSDRIRSASRQGTSFDLVSSQDLLNSNGRTGIFEIDLALAAYNADGNTAMPTVIMTPDDLTGGVGGGRGSTQGPAGTGTTGASGVPGASAYEIAVEQGFSGTESEWITSLQGDGYWSLHGAPTALEASAATLSVTGLAGHRRVRFTLTARSTDTANSTTDLRLRCSGDTSAAYGWVQAGGSNTGNVYIARNDASNASTYIKAGIISTSQSTTGKYGDVDAELVFAAALGRPAYLQSRCVAQSGGSVPDTYVTNHSGTWRNLSGDPTMDNLTLSLGAGQFAPGTLLRVEVAD
jgi:hypothetical protein